MAVVLAVAAAVMLAVAAVLGPDGPSLWLRAVFLICQWLGPLLVILAVVAAARSWLSEWVTRRLLALSGPSIINAMSPRTVLSALLPRVYGDSNSYEEILTGILGGAGRDQDGRDTAVSKSTTASFRLRAIDDVTCISEATWTHEFSGVHSNHKFVVFVTFEPVISNLITSQRVFPLYESWMVLDEDQLEDVIPTLDASLELGITYSDADGFLHVIEPRRIRGSEVALRRYDEFVKLPDSIDRKNLRILEFDLWDLAEDDHVVGSVHNLAIRASSVTPIDTGFITWSPPHPCYVRKVVFDVSDLAPADQTFSYLLVPFTMRANGMSITSSWSQMTDVMELDIDSWMLPGHGVTLLWRPTEPLELSNAP